MASYSQTYYRKNRTKLKRAAADRRRTQPDAAENARLRRIFGITLADYNAMLEAQDGVCAICRRKETIHWRKGGAPKKLTVDHDHVSQEVRGLLCQRCNSILGYAGDNPLVLLSAIEYLRGE